MIQRVLSISTMERFLKEFKKECDSLRNDGHQVYPLPEVVAHILEAINLWEVWRQQQFALTFYDRARSNSEQNIFPNTAPKMDIIFQCECGREIEAL